MEAESSLFESSEMVATFVGSTPLVSDSWKLCKSINSNQSVFSITQIRDVAYVAFSASVSSVDDIHMMVELKNSQLFSALQGQQPPVAIHTCLLNLFMSMFRYTNFQAQIIKVMKETKSLVFTGHSIGGAIASLSSLWLLSNLQSNNNPHAPIHKNNILCITFGSPMLGNESLTRSILQNKWGGNFCHVIANHDIVPRILLLNLIPQLRNSFLQQFPYLENNQNRFFLSVLSCLENDNQYPFWPFGSFLFCTNNGAICLENAKAVIKMMNLMMETASATCSIHDHFIYEYYVGRLNLKSFLNTEDEAFREGVTCCSSYDVGLALALQSSNLESVSEEAKDCLRMAKQMARTPNLNSAHLAIDLSKITPLRAEIEWYKSSCDKSNDRLGYYDTFKLRGASKRDAKVNMNRIRLSQFWDKLIEKIDSNQLPHDFHNRNKWVNASHFYKLLVEPLDIAEYYRVGNHKIKGHYLEHGRDRKYKIFDSWWKNRGFKEENVRTRFASLTQDSCFWARVEEAKDWVENARNISLMREDIQEFQRYARSMIESKEVSKDVLLENSSYSLLMKELSEFKQSGGSFSIS